MNTEESPAQIAQRLSGSARAASQRLATASTEKKNAFLLELSNLLQDSVPRIETANHKDLQRAMEAGLSASLIDRLTLTPERIEAMAQGVREVIDLADPVGRFEDQSQRPNGLQIARMRIPLGVICIVYESRPNVTIDAGVLCIKSGNVPILKGGKEAHFSNGVLVELMCEALERVGLPREAVQAVATSERQVIAELIRRDQEVDLVIPRGGEALIRFVTQNATVPVIQHYKGVCHVYIDQSADLKMAEEIAFNAKVQRPGVCNAMESLLIHRDAAPTLIPTLFGRLSSAGVELRGDSRVRTIWPDALPVTEEDWSTEYLDLTLSVRIVDGVDVALEHIGRYGSKHTEAIVSQDDSTIQRFTREVTASAVMINASTRFNDGYELGLGAEIGISTSRLHAFGPMGLEELTTRKFVVCGQGQVRT